MRKLVVIAVGIMLLRSAPAQLLVEHFNYNNGSLGGSGIGDTVWTGGDSPSVALIVTNAAALTNSSLAGISGSGLRYNGGTFKKRNATFTAQTTGTVYVSFLLNIQTAPSTVKAFVYLHNSTSATSSPELGIFLSGNNIGIGKGVSSPAVSTALSAGTHFIVASYTFQSGADQVALWADPSSLGDNNNIPGSTISTTAGSDGSSLSVIFANHAASQTLYVDELRVGTSWADVTPTSSGPPPPPPSTNGVVITTISFTSGGDFYLQGTGGTPGSNFEIETSTDMTIPFTNWLPAGNFKFDSLGNFGVTSPVTPGTLQRFFTINVGGTNSVPLSPPVILTQPQDTTNSAGTTATFTVGVSGSPPFGFQWYLNSVTPLGGGTNLTLTLNNVQTTDSGGYSVIVSNTAGSVTSVVAQLLVTNVLSAPVIVTQPQDQTVTVSNNASFSVVAVGTQPLSYQWYVNTNTPINNATNATLVLTDVQFTDAGVYSVAVSNNQGATNSNFAALTVNQQSAPNFSQVGYAGYNFNLTGGTGGPTVDVYQLSDMAAYYGTDTGKAPNTPAVLRIHGTVTLRTNGDTYFGNNKTIIGVGTNAAVIGDIGLFYCTNVIVQNLDISNSGSIGDADGVTCKYYPEHIWVDHCTIHDTQDGIVDVTRGGDFVTVSWCKMFYTAPTGHQDVDLIGGDDGDSASDTGALHVTFHHNWWGALCQERLPSVRYGRVHVFNNYYTATGNNYCARTRIDAEVLVEGNWYQNVQNPWELLVTSGTTGKLLAQYNNVGYLDASYGVTWVNGWYPGQSLIPGTDTLTPSSWNPASITDPDPSNVPPYAYTLDNAADVPGLVTNYAGAGKGPFAP
ncbi:MAG TPA: immunoglobulin domain-containing protein [Verrucomicrobiae bacterium]|nr:immunoglobulin domain-containing protein [Verrucomicrobiae bacterium]